MKRKSEDMWKLFTLTGAPEYYVEFCRLREGEERDRETQDGLSR